MNSKFLKYLGVILLSFVISANLYAKDKDENRLNKTTGSPSVTKLNINNLSTYIYNNVNSDIDANGNSGLIFPKGSGRGAMFEAGFLWGGKYGDEVRVGGSAYRQGLQPGKILAVNQAEDPDLPKNRIYRVRRDVNPSLSADKQGDVSVEVKEEGASKEDVIKQYLLDWNEWPASDGAPFEDKNGDGIYNPAVDIPGVKGADQTVWFVANDLDPNLTTYVYGSNPMGLEMQATFWAYSQTGALGNMFFRKYILINKGDKDLTDMYVTMWADPDLGDASDDFAGCDTTLSLGYVYNALARDAVYGDYPPPASGFDFFQGPIVPGSEEDIAIFKGQKIAGKKNLPMTAFYYFARGDASITDPTQGSYEGTTQFYNFMRGRIGLTGELFTTPSGAPTTFALSGDPTKGTGWVDGQLLGMGDRRIGQASGPFTMAIGDTQEVVVAEICAGAIPGTDRLSAIGLLKFYDQQAQLAYDNFFDLPSAPPAPIATATEMDRKIILNWGEDVAAIDATESYNEKGFAFEGYNVYQLPSAAATLEEAKLIATFDLNNGVGKILGQQFDAASGVVINKVLQFGTDGGIKRYFEINQDYLNNVPLVNGLRYYFAVTSYNYNSDPNAVPNTLENPLKIITIIPHAADLGISYGSVVGDTLASEHTAGVSEGLIIPIVIDPTKLTGDTYKVTFDTLHGETVWNLTNVTKNQVVVANQTNQSGDDSYAIVDGVMIKVTGPPSPGMKGYTYTGTRVITFAGAGGAANWGSEGYGGAIGNAYDQWFSSSSVGYDKLANVEIRYATTDNLGNFDVNQQNVSYGYRYMRGAAAPAAKPEFAPFILNPSSGYAFQEFAKNIPFAAYNIETNTRLAMGFLENNAANAVLDGKYFPRNHEDPLSDNIAGTGPREWLFIFATPYSETQDPALATDILNNTLPIMWFMTVNRRFDVPFTDGATFTILANHINTRNDVFTFTAPTTAYSEDQAKADVSKINVFPNPYYGVNSEELNKYQRFVTFSHLPKEAKIRIYNLAGSLIQTIEKNSTSQFERWNLANQNGLPVASGLYIAHIEMPGLGTKILKVAVIQEQQVLDRF